MDNNNVNIPNISNNDMNNPQEPNNSQINNTQVETPAVDNLASEVSNVVPPSISSPSVMPPSVGNGDLRFNEEDGKILMPYVEHQVENILEPTEEKVESIEPKQDNLTTSQLSGIDNNTGFMENKKMEKVEIEYIPPSKFKTALMIIMFLIILGSIIFMPEISKYIERLKTPPEPIISNEEIQSGILKCNLTTNNDRFNLIYSGEFNFSNRELKSLNYSLTTKGDRVEDSTDLTTMYNNCKSLSTELNDKSIGVKVNCDLYDGTLRIDETIDYSELVSKDASEIFKKYSIELADFEADENIGDIERQLKSSNYVCTMESKSE